MAVDSMRNNGSNFRVDFMTESVVKTVGMTPKPYILPLSNFDLLSGRFPVTYFYFFRNPNQFHSPPKISTENLKTSLSQCLSLFRIVANPKTNEPEILCDNHGVLVVEAQANIRLKELEFYNLNKSLEKEKLVTFRQGSDFLVQIQITRYTCGAISLTLTFDHALGDASSFGKFLVTWSELATKKPPSCSPDHRRFLLRPRFPPRYNTSLDETFVSCSLDDIINMPTTLPTIMLKRLYYIDASNIQNLQKLASEDDGIRRTKIEAFSAYIWKVMVNGIDKRHKNCKMGWLVDGRTRIVETCKKGDNNLVMSDYIGNVLSLTFGELTMDELKHGTISQIASHVHAAISTATNAEHFLDLIDWIECHRPGLMLSKMVLGRDGGPAVVVSSGRRFPVGELDFGFGSPVLGTVCSTIERIGVGYINQRPSGRGDGSWTVSAILWPEMVAALESDSESIFQPITAHNLHL